MEKIFTLPGACSFRRPHPCNKIRIRRCANCYSGRVNLHELIIERLSERGQTQQRLAATLGVNRVTMSRWASSLPKRAVLEQVAQALDLPYSRVLQAALEGAGYASCAAELLEGLTVHVVDSDEHACPAAVFTDAERAAQFVAVSNELRYEGLESSAMTVDGTAMPDSVRVYSLVWQNTTGSITQFDRLHAEVPEPLVETGVGEVTAMEIIDPEGICELRVQCLNPEAGRAAMQAARELLSEQDRLLPAYVDVPPVSPSEVFSQYMDFVLASAKPELQRRTGQDLAATETSEIESPPRTPRNSDPGNVAEDQREDGAAAGETGVDSAEQLASQGSLRLGLMQTIPTTFDQAHAGQGHDVAAPHVRRRYITIRLDGQDS